MDKKTEHITICLTKPQRKKAEAIAKAERRPLAQYVALIVGDHLAKVKGTKNNDK